MALGEIEGRGDTADDDEGMSSEEVPVMEDCVAGEDVDKDDPGTLLEVVVEGGTIPTQHKSQTWCVTLSVRLSAYRFVRKPASRSTCPRSKDTIRVRRV